MCVGIWIYPTFHQVRLDVRSFLCDTEIDTHMWPSQNAWSSRHSFFVEPQAPNDILIPTNQALVGWMTPWELTINHASLPESRMCVGVCSINLTCWELGGCWENQYLKSVLFSGVKHWLPALIKGTQLLLYKHLVLLVDHRLLGSSLSFSLFFPVRCSLLR